MSTSLFFRELQDQVKTDIQAGTAPETFMHTFLEKKEEFGLTEEEGA